VLQARESKGSNENQSTESDKVQGEEGVLSRVYVRSRHGNELYYLVQFCTLELVTTSDMAQTGQSHIVSALGVVRSDGSPAIRNSEEDVVRRVVGRIDNRGVDRLSCKVLGCTLVGLGGLAVDLDLITTVEGRDPVIWPRGEVRTTGDLDVGTGMVNRQLTSGDLLAIVAAKLGPLENVYTIRDPRRNLHVHTLAKVGVAGVETIAVAVTGVALALDDVLIAKEKLLIIRGNVVFHSLDESHLNEATIMVVPPPLDRDLLAALEVVLSWDICAIVPAGIIIRREVCRILLFARSRLVHVGVGNNRRGGEEAATMTFLNIVKSVRVRKKVDRSTGRCSDVAM